jgi:hypothetical protein
MRKRLKKKGHQEEREERLSGRKEIKKKCQDHLMGFMVYFQPAKNKHLGLCGQRTLAIARTYIAKLCISHY